MQDKVPETGATPPEGMAEAEILRAFGADSEDATALAAYALHRRARLDFEARFIERHGRAAAGAELDAFLLGEVTLARISAYRAEAGRLMKLQAPAKPARKARWPLFGLWVDTPLAPSAGSEPVNWRGLFVRLLVLLLAVVVTAILLRVLVVQR